MDQRKKFAATFADVQQGFTFWALVVLGHISRSGPWGYTLVQVHPVMVVHNQVGGPSDWSLFRFIYIQVTG